MKKSRIFYCFLDLETVQILNRLNYTFLVIILTRFGHLSQGSQWDHLYHYLVQNYSNSYLVTVAPRATQYRP